MSNDPVTDLRERRIEKTRPLLMTSLNPLRSVAKSVIKLSASQNSYHESPDASQTPPHEIVKRQLKAFNEQWSRVQKNDPFYTWWKETHSLPETVESIERLADFPLLTRQVLLDNEELIFRGRASLRTVTTGGSTATPLRLPVAKEDIRRAAETNRLTRSWYGVSRFDRYVHLWGHSHHLGQGLSGRIRGFVRSGKDLLANGYRLSVYSTDENTAIRQLAQICSIRPSHIIGFSSAITRLATTAIQHSIPVGDCGVRAIFLTADNATREDINLIRRAFGASVAVEYGAIEIGLIAHSHGPTYPLQVLTQNVILTTSDGGDARITTLQRNSFPLINYDIGDKITAAQRTAGSIISISSLDGRTHERLRISTADGQLVEFDARLAYQSLKSIPNIRSIQFRIQDSGLHAFVVQDDADTTYLRESLISDLQRSLGKIAGNDVQVESVPAQIQTLAGKIPLMVRDVTK